MTGRMNKRMNDGDEDRSIRKKFMLEITNELAIH